MQRQHVRALLTVSLLSVLSVANASDFWISKDWKQWSKANCETLLTESPWSHVWRGGGPHGDELVYAVQLRSALPIRQAIVRQLQIDQKYDNMTDTQRNTFDTRASQILNRNYDDVILIHVDFSSSTLAPNIPGQLYPVHTDGTILDASLVTADGTRITPVHFDPNPPYAFNLIFPRTKQGAPLIGEGQKHFSLQFQSPRITNEGLGITVPSQRIGVEFDIEKMTIGEKMSY
jgi:hypothetical protein